MTHTKVIDPAILAILGACRIEGAKIFITSQLDRATYGKVNDVLALMGGKWNRSAKAHVFGEDPTELLDQVIETGEIIDKVKQFQFYQTPAKLAKRMIGLAELDKWTDVLEPSAGLGAIVQQLDGEDFLRVFTCELDPYKCERLEAEFPSAINHRGDFLKTVECGDLQSGGLFNAIVMNPPFSNRQDIKHIRHALKMLAPGGRLVAICSAGPGRAEEFKGDHNGERRIAWGVERIILKCDHWEELPADTFKASGANVRTILMRIRRTQ